MRRGVAVVAVLVTAVLGCDFGVGGAGGGCARVSQDDYDFPVKRVIPGSIAARVTQSGLDFLTARIKTLILSFFDADAEGRAVIPLSTLGLGTISTSLGPFDASVRDLVLTVDLSALSVRLVPGSSPARLEVAITDAEVGLVDGTVAGSFDGFLFTGDAACGLANGPDGRVARLSMTLVFELATDLMSNLQVRVLPSQFDIQDIAITMVTDCDRSECLDGLSPGSTGECLECETLCPVVDLGAELASLVQEYFDGLVDTLMDLIADELMNLVLDDLLNGRPLAIEGELPLAEVMGPMLGWMRTARPLGVLGRPAGEAFRVTGAGATLGLDIALDAGLDAAPPHPCVGDVGTDRIWSAGPRPSFDGLAVDANGIGVPYDVGLGVSAAVINEAIWALWKAGALCIDASTEDLVTLTSGRLLVTAGTLDLLLPGLASITGPDAPIRLTVRPRLSEAAQPGDVVRLGGDPLLVVELADATIGVEALVGDAWMRMVSFRAGLALKIGLRPTDDLKIAVTVADVALTDLSLPDNEIFASARLDVIAPFVVELALGFLKERPLTLDLGLSGLGSALGLPLVPVVVAMGPAGAAGDWLAIYVRLEDAPAEPRAAAVLLPEVAIAFEPAVVDVVTKVDEVAIVKRPDEDVGCAGAGGAPAGWGIGLAIVGLALVARRRRAALAAVLGLGAAACADPGEAPERLCAFHDQCDAGFLCGPAGVCVAASACARDGDCCPGAVCFSGFCRPTAECGPGAGGRACLGLGEVCDGDQCVPMACEGGDACPEPLACVAGRCLAGAPCGGACGAAEVCDVAAERCRAASCDTTCDVGWRVVAPGTPGTTADALACGEPACACGVALDVPLGRPGVDGVLAVDGVGRPALVSYDPAYGDLVLSRWSEAGARTDVVLDGAPEASRAVALASAYRGGLMDPGPDRGRRPALATGPGDWDVVYRDEDRGRLVHARFDPGTGRVASRAELPIDGDVGRYACLVRTQAGLSGLAFVSADASDTVSRLVRFEESGGGWLVSTVLETPLPLRSESPCAGACGLGELCVVAGGGEVCADALQLGGCEPACGPHEACGAVGEAPAACHPRVYVRHEADRLPFGEGLFVACDSDVAAWYDADRRALVVARAPFGPADRLRVDAAPDRDPGHHAAILRTATGVVVAHRDEVGGRLRVGRFADPLGAWTFADVDEGGAWAALAEIGGRVVVAHGEPGAGDVRLAAEVGGCWGLAAPLTDGGFAFPGVAAASGGDVWLGALALAFEDDLDPASGPVLSRVTPPGACGR
ncbi:MAG: hypothetical protein IT385_22770 [Deltaproteobacteria bacterium]|nr:hypothetical protein [Deltaproteobacteria bacterium]